MNRIIKGLFTGLGSASVAILLLCFSLAGPTYAVQNPIQDFSVGEPFEPNYRNFANGAFATIASQFASTTAPASPLLGQLWYNTTSGITTQWNGSSWVSIGGGSGGSSNAVGAAGTLQASNGATNFQAFAGSGPLASHQFANQINALGVLSGAQPTDQDLAFSDNLTGNVSTTAHGFVPKAPNDTTLFLRGDGTWAVPPGTGGGGGGSSTLDSRAGNPFASQAALQNTLYTLYTFSVPGGTLGTTGQISLDAQLSYTNVTTADAPSIGISFGSASLLGALPTSINTGTATGMWLECKVSALGGVALQAARCRITVGNGTGISSMFNLTLTQASGSAQAIAIVYNNTISANSTIKLYHVRVRNET